MMGKLLIQVKDRKLCANEELVPGDVSAAEHRVHASTQKALAVLGWAQAVLLEKALPWHITTLPGPSPPAWQDAASTSKSLLLAPVSLTSTTSTWLCSLIKQRTYLSPVSVYNLHLAYESQSNWRVRQLIMFLTEHDLSTLPLSFPSFNAKLCLQCKKMKLLMPHKCWGECRINAHQSTFSPFPSAPPLCMVKIKFRDKANFCLPRKKERSVQHTTTPEHLTKPEQVPKRMIFTANWYLQKPKQ